MAKRTQILPRARIKDERLVLRHKSTKFADQNDGARALELATKNRLALMSSSRETIAAGGVISISADFPLLYERSASYVDKIIKGAKPVFLFTLPNENAGHSAPERIRITEVGRFYEPLVAVQIVVMQLVGAGPSVTYRA